MARNGAWRDGGTLRVRLVALVLIPLLGVAGFAAVQVRAKMHSADDAGRAQRLVVATAHLSATRAGVLQELLPDMTLAVRRNSAMSAALGLDTSTVALPSESEIFRLRSISDQRLSELAHDPLTAASGVKLAAHVKQARTDIDSGIGLLGGFNGMMAVSGRLLSLERSRADQLASVGLSAGATAAIADLQRVTNLAQNAELELMMLASTKFAQGLAVSGSTTPVWLENWSQYGAAVQSVTNFGAPAVAKAVRTALATPEAKAFDAAATRAVRDPASVTVATLFSMYQPGQVRDNALAGVVTLAVDRSLAAAAAMHNDAVTALWVTLGIALLLVLICGALAFYVLRSIARPLDRLARSAREVSRGNLDDVAVVGPHEVRTAARGLSAAVANLRNIETQAAAVSRGDLDSEVVREPLPGPLGAVVQASIETIIGAIHDRDAAKTDLAYRAAHDALTELPNRAQAMMIIEQALHRAQRTGATTGLMFIDLDHFKIVNDTFGHDAGDAVLRVAARRMQDEVRTGDTVCRLGGDEFVIVLEQVESEADFVKLAERLVAAIAAPIPAGGRDVRVGASVGVAVCRDAYVEGGRLLAEADAAVYRAKQSGRGRVEIFDDELRDSLARRSELEGAIAFGLANGEFLLHYQPVVEMRTGRPTGVEALIRWQRPGHGLVRPDDFIPIAEASSLIDEIGRWTLREATSQLARWDESSADHDLTVAVNISGRHLAGSSLLDDVRTALRESGIAPQRLIVEITETVLVDDPLATANMVALRAMGVQVAIDDFGTGYTSIGQLPRLPIDTIKIDRSFVASTDPAHRDLVRLIVAAAHAFDLTVVAEGVELPGHVAALSAVDVEIGQGFFFARPQPAGEAMELTREDALPDSATFALARTSEPPTVPASAPVRAPSAPAAAHGPASKMALVCSRCAQHEPPVGAASS